MAESMMEESIESIGLAEKFQQKLVPFVNAMLWVTKTAFFAMLLLTVIDVTGRFVFNMPVLGSIELIELLMAIATFPIFCWVQQHGGHLRVDLIFSQFPRKWQNIFDVLTTGLASVFMCILAYHMFFEVTDAMEMESATVLLGIRQWPFILYAAICLSIFSFLLIVQTCVYFHKACEHGGTLFAVAAALFVAALTAIPFIWAATSFGFEKYVLAGLMMCYMFVFLLIGMPIGLAMATVGLQRLLLTMPMPDMALAMAAGTPFHSVSQYTMSVVPMFILMGEIALHGDISTDLFNVANKWLGHLPGGLAVATICGCAGFAAVCGESLPTAMTMATVSLPAMREKNYDPAFATSCLCVGGPLGILIPPSMGFIIYSIITEESVGRLFMAGIIPGILLTAVLCLIVIFRALRHPELAPRGDRHSFRERVVCLPGVLPMLFLFVVIIGGILTGICTPTEGGAIGGFAALLYCIARRRITVKKLWESLGATAKLTGLIFVILMGVNILNALLSTSRLPFMLSEFIMAAGFGKYTFMLAVVIMYLILGMLMNVIPMIMLTLPAIFPAVQALGFDPIWFGVVVVVLMELGQVTPPIGVIVFAMSTIVPDVPMGRIFKHVTPFFFGILLVILLLIAFPDIALWLPHYLFS